MLSQETVFLTGFPGFIATRLLRQLAAAGARFLLLVQPALREQARKEVEDTAAETGRSISDFVLLQGDITEPNLGLSAEDLELARSESTVVFHLAALYDLAVAQLLAQRVNVAGTRNVNDFVRSLSRLKQYHYVSTCYVAGKRKGRILETELRHEAGFRNYYEETKYLAEIEVEKLKSALPVTIHRPSVVCGDSRTGETAKFDGIYYLIRYLNKWPTGLSALNIGNSEVDLNLVPVDFVVEAMAALTLDPQALGKTLQIADPNPLSTRELFNTIAESLGGRKSFISLPAPLIHRTLMLPVIPNISGLPHSAVPYFFLKQSYDTAQARQLLEPHGVSCPPFRSYAQTIVEFAVEHFRHA
ncbi:MAG TPA: SDR family oxidoreductase [Pyrinomonadaceae bacterium]|nr:SDR family oxidoreductase [Pyrinomonadaceae bacterium]